MLPPRSSLACLLAVVSVLVTPPAHADDGQTVHRCAGRHGEIVFSGLPCTAGSAVGASAAATAPPVLAARTCPHSREELGDRVAAAIGRHDANALAGLLRWGGVGAGAADGRLRVLRKLAAQPLLAIDNYADSDAEAYGLHVRTGSGDSGGVREHSFGISVAAGCHWLVW
jgi:hypothetical protein